jgi:hypothetical protein
MDLSTAAGNNDEVGPTDGDGEEEYEATETEPDDETTIAQEESLPRDMSYKQEIDLLQEEANLSIEELRRKYSAIEAEAGSNDQSDRLGEQDREADDNSNEEGEEEFIADETEVDDETTMAQEESLPRDMSYKEEIDLLESEANIPIEDLRAKYGVHEYGIESADEGEDRDIDGLEEDDSVNIDDEEDFVANEHEVDDETTMAAEEALPQEMGYQEEINVLQAEANLSVDELRNKYAAMYETTAGAEEGSVETTAEAEAEEGSDSDDNDEVVNADSDEPDPADDDAEFQPSLEHEVDDETTIEAEEKLTREMTYEEEISMLERENNMSVEELRAMYSGLLQENVTQDSVTDNSSSDEEESDEMDSQHEFESIDGKLKRKHDTMRDNQQSENAGSDAKRRKEPQVESDDGAEALNALEASAERARQTLATRPFLLANWVKLRKYQQVGLNWLVSMQTRRLNGILADGTSISHEYFLCRHWRLLT